MVFSFPGRDIVVAGGSDGKLYLLDSRSLGGPDHHTPLFATNAIASNSHKARKENGFHGGFSTWFDPDTGTRRIYVPVFGPLRKTSGFTMDAAAAGSLIAFDLRGTNERPTLEPKWASGPLLSPAPAVIANGMVFVLSNTGKELSGASLHVLDAITGKDLYSSAVATSIDPANGFALANGRIYFTGHDNAVYCFGIPAQHTQLITQ